MSITIYHNPGCSTSRAILASIRAAGHEPRIIEYLKTPPSRAELTDLIARAGLTVRGILRRRAPPYAELNLADPTLSDAALLDAIMAHPVLIERPIVVTDAGVRLCRPPERLQEILPI